MRNNLSYIDRMDKMETGIGFEKSRIGNILEYVLESPRQMRIGLISSPTKNKGREYGNQAIANN